MPMKKILVQIVSNRAVFAELSSRDIKYKYFSTIGGTLWLILDPILFVALLWLIFSNFKSGPNTDVPFLAYLATGFCLWQLFSTILSGGTNSIKQYSFLVTKINFPIFLIPMVKVCSALIINFIFLGVIFILLSILGITPTVKWGLALYYQFSVSILSLGLIYITSSINIFIKDMTEIVNIVVRFGFWLTPIFWSIDRIPEKAVEILKYNPMFYIVEGFREALLPNYSRLELSDHIYFWGFTISIFILGTIIFKKLKPYFAEVL